MLIHGKKLIGLPVYTQGGQHLGHVVDLEIDIDSQSIVNYQVGNFNPIKNLWGDKLLVNRQQVVSISAERLVVEDNVKEAAAAISLNAKAEAPASEAMATSTLNAVEKN
ncbi:MAG: PRC-barrel domain-containing protein [Patescibacteria group bacterium]|jgi:sporulation protein YlmC with PRC-barrel domain